jgi:hypothetical protein
MKKGDRPNPGEEFLYKLSGDKEFQQDVYKARIQLRIPPEGYADKEMRHDWLKKHDVFDLLAIEMHLQKKYKISIAFQYHLDDYIFFGKTHKETNKTIAPVVIDTYAHKMDLGDVEEFYKKTGEAYAKLFILGNSSKSEVLSFINTNWEKIESILREQRGEKKVLRKTIYKERNQRIKKLWRMPTKELQKMAGSDSSYKDSLIQKILENEGVHVTDGYIRKIRYSK